MERRQGLGHSFIHSTVLRIHAEQVEARPTALESAAVLHSLLESALEIVERGRKALMIASAEDVNDGDTKIEEYLVLAKLFGPMAKELSLASLLLLDNEKDYVLARSSRLKGSL